MVVCASVMCTDIAETEEFIFVKIRESKKTMNPADFGMFWMNQYAQAERMVMDESTNYYSQPSIGMTVMDDISHQNNSMVS